MAIIGTFSRSAEGYAGAIRTMTINADAQFIKNDKKGNQKAPDYRIIAEGVEFGAAWRVKNGGDKKPSLSVELDDPSFHEPLRAALFENNEGEPGVLVWNRK